MPYLQPNAALPLLLVAQLPYLSVAVVAAIAVLLWEVRGLFSRSRDDAMRSQPNAAPPGPRFASTGAAKAASASAATHAAAPVPPPTGDTRTPATLAYGAVLSSAVLPPSEHAAPAPASRDQGQGAAFAVPPPDAEGTITTLPPPPAGDHLVARSPRDAREEEDALLPRDAARQATAAHEAATRSSRAALPSPQRPRNSGDADRTLLLAGATLAGVAVVWLTLRAARRRR